MKKALIILLALLCVAPVFAAKKTGIEAGLELGFANSTSYVHDQFKKALDPYFMHEPGFEFGANVKYDVDKAVSAYAKFDYQLVGSVSAKIGDTKHVEEVPDGFNVFVLKFAAGALYDLDVDFGVRGLTASVGGGIAFNSCHQVHKDSLGTFDDYYSTLALDVMVEGEYEIKDGIAAFIDFEPQIALLNGGGAKYTGADINEKLASVFKAGFGFSVTAGARYAF